MALHSVIAVALFSIIGTCCLAWQLALFQVIARRAFELSKTRGGNASFEEVVCSLEVLHGIDTGIQLEKTCELSRFMEEISGIRLQPNKAIVGKLAFLEESHFMIRKAAEDAGHPEAVLPFVPQMVGARPRLVIGTSSLYVGAIEYLLDQWGMPCDPEVVEAIRSQVKTRLARGGYLEQEELHAIAQDVIG